MVMESTGTAVSPVLLFIGIHKAWDSVTRHVLVKKPEHQR